MLSEQGFPIAKSKENGTFYGQRYYVENSLGEKQFSRLFIEDWKKTKRISPPHFKALVGVVKRVARAQLQNVQIEGKIRLAAAKGFYLWSYLKYSYLVRRDTKLLFFIMFY